MDVIGPLIIIAILLIVLIVVARLLREHFLLLIVAGFIYGAWVSFQNRFMLGAAIGFSLLAVILLLMYFTLRHDRERMAFLSWLASHEVELREGSVGCGEHRLSLDSSVTQYSACVSLFFATFEYKSRYLIGGEPTRWANALFSITTIIAGWWGLPYGPWLSVKALTSNIRGGERQTVRDLLRLMERDL